MLHRPSLQAGSGIREIMALAWALEAELGRDGPWGERVIHLEVGQPNFAAPEHVVEATAAAVHVKADQRYIPNAGLSEVHE